MSAAGVGKDGVERLTVLGQELLAHGAVHHGLQLVIIAVGVEYGHGLRVAAELLEREGLEEFLEGADAARESYEGVGHILHRLLALGHRLRENHLRAAVQYARLVEEARRDAYELAALALNPRAPPRP